MGDCGAHDPACAPRWAQTIGQRARGAERDFLHPMDWVSVEGVAQRPAAEEHGARLSGTVELGRHVGAHPPHALRGGAGAGGKGSKAGGGDHRHADRQGCSKRGSWLDPSGYDAGKKIKGRKRHILVDTLGLWLNVVVHPADVQDRDGAFHLLRRARRLFPFNQRIFADGGYSPLVTQPGARPPSGASSPSRRAIRSVQELFMLKTCITEQYGLKVPFINAGMAFIATAPLARAVCKAGGMGMLGIPAMPPDVLRAAIRDIKAVDPACFGVDIIARFSGIEHIKVCVTEKVPVVVFFWDDAPDEWLSRLRAAGSHIWFQVGSVDEAKAALQRGGQVLVVQGSEAGGHNRAAAATFSLLPAVIDAVPSVPVVAAGGIADGRTVAAALALGAD